MAKASDNRFPRVIFQAQPTSIAAPANSDWYTFAKADGIYARSSNTTVGPFGTGSSSAPAFVGASVSGTSTATNNSTVALAFADADTYDTDSIHDPVTNNTRLTVPTGKTGKWLLTVYCAFGAGSTDRRLSVRVDGTTSTTLVRQYYNDGSASNRVSASHVLSLTAGQYVEVTVFTDTSVTNNPYGATFTFLGA